MITKIVFGYLFALLSVVQLQAQTDPTLAGMIVTYTDKAKDQLKAQEKTMMMQTTGHLWIREEVEATTNLQRKYNEYLDSFRDIISYAAQIYGFYHEIGKLSDHMGELNKQLQKNGQGAFAVALTPRRNRVYRELILGSVEIVNDIRQVCLSKTKMTEKQRIEIVLAIRPKLQVMNRKLQRLSRAVKYTSFSDVWAGIDEGARPKANKSDITKACMRRWKTNIIIKRYE